MKPKTAEYKVFKVADIRNLEKQVALGEISYSRMVEIMNEMAFEYQVKRLCEKLDAAIEKTDNLIKKLR